MSNKLALQLFKTLNDKKIPTSGYMIMNFHQVFMSRQTMDICIIVKTYKLFMALHSFIYYVF